MGGILGVSRGGAISGNNTNENFPIAPGEDPTFIDPSLPMSPISNGVKKYSNLSFTNQTVNGVQFNLVDNYVLVNGTSTGPINFLIGTIENLNIGRNYKLRGVYNGMPSEIYADVNGSIYSDNGNGVVFPTDVQNGVLGLNINSGVSFNNRKLYPEVIKNNFWENSNLKTIADETLKDIADAIRYAGRFVGSFPARLIPDYINRLNTYSVSLPDNEYGVLALGENGQLKKLFANNWNMLANWDNFLIDSNLFYDMSYMFFNAAGNNGINPYMSDYITNMEYAYYYCQNVNIEGKPLEKVCGNNVVNMDYAYYFSEIRPRVHFGQNVKSAVGAYAQSFASGNIDNYRDILNNFNNLADIFEDCPNLTGQPACGPNVVNMSMAYRSCYNLTGQPICGPNVVNMNEAYYACRNLTGYPVCGPNVVNMSFAYYGCKKLVGHAMIGDNVQYTRGAYIGCENLNEIAYFVQSTNALKDCQRTFWLKTLNDYHYEINNSPINIVIVKKYISAKNMHRDLFWTGTNNGSNASLNINYAKISSPITSFILNINGHNLISEIGDVYYNSKYNKTICEEVSNRYE